MHVHIRLPTDEIKSTVGERGFCSRVTEDGKACELHSPFLRVESDCFSPWRIVMIVAPWSVAGWIPRGEDDSETRIIQSSAVLTNGV